jgi:hypothetical protein
MNNPLGKDEETSRLGIALVSVAITEKQKDNMQQYDDDSAVVGSSLDAMDKALDDLSSDVRELGRCLKQTTFAASQLQKVQTKINNQIKNMLRREKVKMELKEKNILGLDRKLRKIQRNQRSLIFGYKMYKLLRYVVIFCLIVIVSGGVWFQATNTQWPKPLVFVPAPAPFSPKVVPAPSPSFNCTYVNCTCVPH